MERRLVFVLWVALLSALAGTAGGATKKFRPVKNLKAAFVASSGGVKVSWQAVPGASNYRLVVKDPKPNKIVFSATVAGTQKLVPGSKWVPGKIYTISVHVLQKGSVAASKPRLIKFPRKGQEIVLGTVGTLKTKNSSGRSGAFYLPRGYSGKKLPILVAYHGSGSDYGGMTMVKKFRDIAERRGFIIVAPSSRINNGRQSWQPGSYKGEVTPDMTHTLKCLREVLKKRGVNANPNRFMVLGYSGGGWMAPYMGTSVARFTHFASCHSGTILSGLGTKNNKVKGWFSTGVADTKLTPSRVKNYYAAKVRKKGFKVIYRQFPGGHQMSDSEVSAVINWWLSS